MNQLNDALIEFVKADSGVTAGFSLGSDADIEGQVTESSPSADRLLSEVKSLKKRADVTLAIGLSMIVTLFLIEIYLIMRYIENAAVVQQIATVFGISAAGLIALTFRIFRDRDRQAIVIMLANALEPSDLRDVLKVLLVTWYPTSR